jgi:hypothetical protein
MPSKVHVYSVKIESREVELPDNCPNCGALLTESGAISIGQYSWTEQRAAIDPGNGLLYGDCDDSAGEILATAYACRGCLHTLAKGEG